jgi:hypothetical protein
VQLIFKPEVQNSSCLQLGVSTFYEYFICIELYLFSRAMKWVSHVKEKDMDVGCLRTGY